MAYLIRLSGRGYRCCWSAQNGHVYPRESCTRPCRIMSFFILNPLPPAARGQPFTGQKYGRDSLWTFAWECRRYRVWNGGAAHPGCVHLNVDVAEGSEGATGVLTNSVVRWSLACLRFPLKVPDNGRNSSENLADLSAFDICHRLVCGVCSSCRLHTGEHTDGSEDGGGSSRRLRNLGRFLLKERWTSLGDTFGPSWPRNGASSGTSCESGSEMPGLFKSLSLLRTVSS